MLPTIALMVPQHPNLSCFAMLISCHLFSVRPEISPWTALESWVVQSMSCTQKKWKEKNINNWTLKNKRYWKPTQQLDFKKQKVLKANPTTQLIKICTTLRWQWSIQDKVLCRKLATKRVEDDEDKQSACSEVLVRQISQLPNARSGDSLQLMKSVASASCCKYSCNLLQNS
jgi:hypothetical protein